MGAKIETCFEKQDQESDVQRQLLENSIGDEKVLTGQDNRVIMRNIAEADSVEHERQRDQLGEQYRTFLGDFCYESGHFYFGRLIVDADWITPYREILGHEGADYGESLTHHYANDSRTDWGNAFFIAYASSHRSKLGRERGRIIDTGSTP